jgi:GTP-binding protein
VPAIVAIVGRPNVGKSTLFNRFAGRRAAIVDDQPGVTRDRHYTDTHLHGRDVTLVDTGGFDPGSDDPMRQGIERQLNVAVAEADVVICVLDGTQPPTSADREAVALLRRSGKPVIFTANKVDNDQRALDASELYSLGMEKVHFISALHGRGLGTVESDLADQLPPARPVGHDEGDGPPRVALVGRPNAGKSSLFNHLSGSERALVDHRPGTTRDPIDSRVEHGGRQFVLVDTAGIRRRSKVDRGVEGLSVMRAIKAVDRAQVVVLMADATDGIREQDARLLGLCAERQRAIVVGLNKMDLLDAEARERSLETARIALHFAPWAPIVSISAKTGKGIDKLMDTVWAAAEQFQRRIETAALNRFFEKVLEHHSPPTSGGKAPRIYFITQAETAPPIFVAVSNAPANIPASYRRFVQNQIRKSFGFDSVPVTVRYRKKKGREDR